MVGKHLGEPPIPAHLHGNHPPGKSESGVFRALANLLFI